MSDANPNPTNQTPDVIDLNGTKKLLYPDGRVFRFTDPPDYVDLAAKYALVDAAQDVYRREMARKCGAETPDLPRRVHEDNQPEIVFANTGLRYNKTKYGFVIRER